MRPELYVVVSLRSSSLRDKRSVLEINFVLNDKPDNILHFLIINKSYEKTKTTQTPSLNGDIKSPAGIRPVDFDKIAPVPAPGEQQRCAEGVHWIPLGAIPRCLNNT